MMDSHTKKLIKEALKEDLGPVGDLTAQYFVPENLRSVARMISREACVLAGIEIAAEVFQGVDDSLQVEIHRPSGTRIDASEINQQAILEVSGSTRSILTAERTALNFAQRLTGVATLTRRFVDAVQGTGTVILDTRKTTPGWRALEKAAVRWGGGQNHRMGLYDRVMVKDNHLAAEDRQSALQQGIDLIRLDHPEVQVELEADSLDQVARFLHLRGVDYILLDNMSTPHIRQAVEMAKDSSIRLEASGGMTLRRVREVAETGVHFISVGALTHSAKAVDLSLEIDRQA